jgi:hypothetical protein
MQKIDGQKYLQLQKLFTVSPRINARVLEENALCVNSDWHEICICIFGG